VRKAIYQSFKEVGGKDYLVWLSKKEPRAYASLLAKVLPQAIEAKVEGEDLPLVIYRNYAGEAGRRGNVLNDVPSTPPPAQ